MTTRWEVEKAVKGSSIEPTGRHILLTLLSETNAATAEIPSTHVPSYTDLEGMTGLSRSALTEWMKALADGGWFMRRRMDGDSRACVVMMAGDPSAARAPRPRADRNVPGSRASVRQAETRVDGSCRPAVWAEDSTVPPGGMDRAAERYGDVSPGGTPDGSLLIRNSPTESSTTNPTLNPPLFAEATPDSKQTKTRRPRKSEEPREDVQRICEYLVEAVVANGSKRPAITEKWRTEARLLLDEERNPKATPERVIALIDWIKTSEWWRAKVLSMPKLRAKYDEIRLDAVREFNRNQQRQGGVPARYESRGTVAHSDRQVVRESAEARKAAGWLALGAEAQAEYANGGRP